MSATPPPRAVLASHGYTFQLRQTIASAGLTPLTLALGVLVLFAATIALGALGVQVSLTLANAGVGAGYTPDVAAGIVRSPVFIGLFAPLLVAAGGLAVKASHTDHVLDVDGTRARLTRRKGVVWSGPVSDVTLVPTDKGWTLCAGDTSFPLVNPESELQWLAQDLHARSSGLGDTADIPAHLANVRAAQRA